MSRESYAERTLVAIKTDSRITPPFNVYIDDSTQHRYGKKIVGIGAYIGTVESWARFEGDWHGVLRRGPFPYFHTTDFLARKTPFRNGWSDHQRNEFMERVTTTVSEYPTLGINAAIVCDEYEAVFPPDVQHGWRDPRLFAFFSLLAMLHGMITDKESRLSLPKPLYFLIERQRGFVGNAMELFLAVKAKFDTTGLFSADLQQGDDQTYPALQAADVLVYEAVRKLVENERDPESEMRKPFEILRRKQNIVPMELRGDLLRQYVEFLREDQADKPS